MVSADIQDAIDRIIEGPAWELNELNKKVICLEAVAEATKKYHYCLILERGMPCSICEALRELEVKMYKVELYYPGKVRSELEEGLNDEVYGRWASGYSIEEDVRDIAFDVETLGLVYDLLTYLPLDGWITVRHGKAKEDTDEGQRR